jgi:hypothetical protein
VVFQIPSKDIDNVFHPPDHALPSHLAYVKWFSPIPATPDSKHLMYKVSRIIQDGRQSMSIISVKTILASVHLLPRFGAIPRPGDLNTFTVLDQYDSFYINPFTSMYHYLTFG